MPIWYYYVETTSINGKEIDRIVKTNLKDQSNPKNDFVSDKTKTLRESIKNKRIEMKKLANQEKFEDALLLKNEIASLEVELAESVKLDEEEYQKNKSASERLKELDAKLKKAVQNEEYELAAQIRDQIKSLDIK
jgi:protein-arginine kinase activator protein McsA